MAHPCAAELLNSHDELRHHRMTTWDAQELPDNA